MNDSVQFLENSFNENVRISVVVRLGDSG